MRILYLHYIIFYVFLQYCDIDFNFGDISRHLCYKLSQYETFQKVAKTAKKAVARRTKTLQKAHTQKATAATITHWYLRCRDDSGGNRLVLRRPYK